MLQGPTQGLLWSGLLLLSATCRIPDSPTPQESADGIYGRTGMTSALRPKTKDQDPSVPEGLLHCILRLKGVYQSTKGGSLQLTVFYSPAHPSISSRERGSACPACGLRLCPLSNLRLSQGPSPVPTPFQLLPHQERPLRTRQSLVAWCPLALPFLHIGDAGNAYFWVSSANTSTSLNSPDAQ